MSLCLAGSVRAEGGFPGFDVGNPITVLRPPYAVHGSRQGDAKIRDVQPFAGGLDRCIGLPGRDGGAVQAVQGAVSYTHLDVYKRQGHKGESVSVYPHGGGFYAMPRECILRVFLHNEMCIRDRC